MVVLVVGDRCGDGDDISIDGRPQSEGGDECKDEDDGRPRRTSLDMLAWVNPQHTFGWSTLFASCSLLLHVWTKTHVHMHTHVHKYVYTHALLFGVAPHLPMHIVFIQWYPTHPRTHSLYYASCTYASGVARTERRLSAVQSAFPRQVVPSVVVLRSVCVCVGVGLGPYVSVCGCVGVPVYLIVCICLCVGVSVASLYDESSCVHLRRAISTQSSSLWVTVPSSSVTPACRNIRCTGMGWNE